MRERDRESVNTIEGRERGKTEGERGMEVKGLSKIAGEGEWKAKGRGRRERGETKWHREREVLCSRQESPLR